MPNRTEPATAVGTDPEVPADVAGETGPDASARPSAAELAAALPIAGLTPRRLAWVAVILFGAWLAVAFVRQVGDASTITDRAQALRAANAGLRGEVASLDQERLTIQRPEFIALEARAHRLGTRDEVPFALEAGAPALPADAPGSRSVALGAVKESRSPLETWLTVLFGPGR